MQVFSGGYFGSTELLCLRCLNCLSAVGFAALLNSAKHFAQLAHDNLGIDTPQSLLVLAVFGIGSAFTTLQLTEINVLQQYSVLGCVLIAVIPTYRRRSLPHVFVTLFLAPNSLDLNGSLNFA